MHIPSLDDIFRVIAANPHATVPFAAVVAEFLIVFAARRALPGLTHVSTVTDITAFAAAATVLSAGALQGTFLTSRMPGTSGATTIVAYALVLPILLLSDKIRPQPLASVSRLEYVGRYIAGALLLAVAAAYFWVSLVLAAVYSQS